MPNLNRRALVIVDVQKGFDDRSYLSPTGRPTLKPELTGQPKLLVTEGTNSAFYGEADLMPGSETAA